MAAGHDARTWSAGLPAVCIGALALRLTYLAELRHTPIVAVVMGDGLQYDAWAQEIARGHWVGSQVFYQTPLYPYLLAVFFRLAGHHLFAVRVAQACLGAVSCVLLGLAGRRFFNARVGVIAAAALAIYPPAIFFDGVIQKSSVDLFLITLLLTLLGEFLARRRWPWLAAAGAVLAALTLNRENARVLYPIILGWILIVFRDARWTTSTTSPTWRTRAAWAAVFTAAVAVVLLPVGVRNYRVGGAFLISTSQLGPNFYIGNHAGAQGTYEPLVAGRGNAVFEREDAVRLAEAASGRTLSAGEVSDYWLHRSLADILGDPRQWLRLMGRKTLLTLNAAEIVDTESIEAYSDYSALLRGLRWIDFGLVLPLAALGAWRTRRQWRELSLLYAIAGGLALSVALFYVLARYRYPMVPVVLLFAAAAFGAMPANGAMPAKTEKHDWRRDWAPGLVLALVAAVVCHLPVKADKADKADYDDTLYNLGSQLITIGRPADAIAPLQKAIAASPGYAPLHHNLGVAFSAVGDKPRAAEEFATAVRLRPSDFEAHSALALTLRDLGRTGEALQHFEEAVRLQPDSAAAHNNLAAALQQEGRIDEAVRHFETALRLEPAYAEARRNIAVVLVVDAEALMARGRTRDAIALYERATTLAPESLQTWYLLANAYARENRLSDAVASLEKALAIARASGRSDAADQVLEALVATQKRMRRQ